MRRYAPQRIRNVALVGHHGSGKTTLAEALLHTAGAIPRRGRVEDGTTTTDHEPEEHERQMSLSLSLAPFEWRDHKVNLLDVPGEADCTGALQAALGVADLAVVVDKAVSVADVNAAFRKAAEGELKGILQYTEEELVSSDYIGNPHSCILDAKSTNVVDGTLLKVSGWYDNEWGYASRCVDLLQLVGKQL